MKIRRIRMEDLADFISLADQLGYRADRSYVGKRIEEGGDSEVLFVAEEGSGIIGWVDARVSRTFLKDSRWFLKSGLPWISNRGSIIDDMILKRAI